jgi:hypothetical protein
MIKENTMQFEIGNTHQIQVDSMTAFMQSIGYKYVNKGWESEVDSLKHIRRLSHRTAIALHNLQADEWVQHEDGTMSPAINGNIFDMRMGPYMLAQVQAAKIVQKVKMQPNRKAVEGIELQYHMVKPMQPYMTIALGLVA